jgi:signal peptidase
MKFFKAFYYIFIVCVALVAVLLLISAFPIAGNFKVLVVLSGSMEPAIKTGSAMVIKPAADYKIGDIITFGPMSKKRTPTTHRIVGIKAEGGNRLYITKGDANNAPDIKEIAENEIIGKVLFSAPYAGYFVAAAKKPLGFTLIIGVPAAIIIFDEIKKMISEIKKMKEKKQKIAEEKNAEG